MKTSQEALKEAYSMLYAIAKGHSFDASLYWRKLMELEKFLSPKDMEEARSNNLAVR